MSRHIDGVRNARHISRLAEVDMEMVQACLRVLKYHGVIELVDMFFYSNIYETSSTTARLLSTPKGSELLRDAAAFAVKGRFLGRSISMSNVESSPDLPSTSPLRSSTFVLRSQGSQLSNKSLEPLHGTYHDGPMAGMKPEDVNEMQNAVAEFFCCCRRDTTVGDLWIDLLQGRIAASSYVDWKKVFRMIDHRRLVVFGMVHGLVRRVRNFPFLVGNDGMHKDFSSLSFEHLRMPTSPRSSKLRRQEERRNQIAEAAKLMDGTHCDDEISVALELSLSEVFALFEGKTILSVYAPNDEML